MTCQASSGCNNLEGEMFGLHDSNKASADIVSSQYVREQWSDSTIICSRVKEGEACTSQFQVRASDLCPWLTRRQLTIWGWLRYAFFTHCMGWCVMLASQIHHGLRRAEEEQKVTASTRVPAVKDILSDEGHEMDEPVNFRVLITSFNVWSLAVGL